MDLNRVLNTPPMILYRYKAKMIKCTDCFCDEYFSTKKDMLMHRKSMHARFVNASVDNFQQVKVIQEPEPSNDIQFIIMDETNWQ
jgi:hypothetical protein